jgi:hypothetical protein
MNLFRASPPVIVGGDSIPNTAEKCTLIDQKKTKLLLPLFSTDFYPDGNSPGKHHGK